VTSIGEIFRGNTNVKSFEELRYFTSLTELPANAFRGAMSLQTVYLPASITSIGDYAFTGCSLLRYVVMLNDQTMLPLGFAGLPFNTTIFVPKSMLEAYQNDEAWSDRRDIVEFTGQPVVTASASRQYGRRSANIRMMVLGAPIDGDPVCTCDVITEPTLPVGDYPISIAPGTVTTLGVDFREGVFTVEPAPLTITAKSYTRFKGQPNPAFEVDYKGFRNRETEEVLTVKPVVICEATAESPVGEYDITVSGAEAQNYEITYVAGKLTVENDPSGIVDATLLMDRGGQLYDLQGRRVSQPRRGLFVKGRRKLVVRP
jgi:hypothetical protein